MKKIPDNEIGVRQVESQFSLTGEQRLIRCGCLNNALKIDVNANLKMCTIQNVTVAKSSQINNYLYSKNILKTWK